MPQIPDHTPHDPEDSGSVVTAPLEFVIDRWLSIVLAAGGERIEAPCRSDDIPELNDHKFGPAYTCGCGGETLVKIPYQREDGTTGYTEMCAICDAGFRAPRFLEAV